MMQTELLNCEATQNQNGAMHLDMATLKLMNCATAHWAHDQRNDYHDSTLLVQIWITWDEKMVNLSVLIKWHLHILAQIISLC